MQKECMHQDAIRQWLKDQLDRSGQSQSALARALGLDPSMVNKVLKGRRALKAREMADAASFFGCAPPGAFPGPIRSDDQRSKLDRDLYRRAYERAEVIEKTLYGGLASLDDFVIILENELDRLRDAQ